MNNTTYEIRENSQYNSREIYFSGKPEADTREALKSLKMRWNPKKSCWYGFATEAEIISAIRNAEATTEPGTGAIIVTDGYMGGGAVYGSKSGLHLYGAELSAAIRKDIKAAGIKGVTVRCKTYSGGQSIGITATIERADIKHDFMIDDSDLLHLLNKYGAYDGEKWVYYSKELDSCESAAWIELREKVSRHEREKYSKDQQLNHYYLDQYPEIMPEFIAKLKKVLDIVRAYNYDASNSMVDYFDTNFYYNIDTKPGKSWTAVADTTDIDRAAAAETKTA